MALSLNCHKTQEILHVDTEKPRAYFVPGATEAQALNENRAISSRFLSLCGDWDFEFYPVPDEIKDFTQPDFVMARPEKMTVPRSWQTVPGHDTPNYCNVNYPIPFDPPYVPEENPSALYHRTFYLDGAFTNNRELYLNFEGVDSCFYLFINNQIAGYSQVSHCTSEFNITSYVQEGENDIKVLVFKWCDGTYLEDQDKFRYSGIFREVYILSRDKAHIADIYAKQEVSADFKTASLKVELELTEQASVEYRLVEPDGKEIAQGKAEKTSGDDFTVAQAFTVTVACPSLWSDEIPSLYTLILHCGDEFIAQRIGFRRFEIINRVIYVNGQKMKGRGVNRHDSHPYLGYATPMDHMKEDLYILKRHNINMIRTSHYPNDPRFMELCDRLGFYVCDETDYETHGAIRIGDWGYFSQHEEWTESLMDRVTRLVERDKNHACVLFWSLGNESGMGDNQHKMSDYIKARIPGALVHCEDITRQMYLNPPEKRVVPASMEGQLECPWIDMESMMYPSYRQIENLLKDKKRTKPFFMCEYCHAMGNGPGDLAAYWELIRKYDTFFGGCVWEFTDHSVATGEHPYTDPHFVYGGDFGDWPSDSNFCVDGLVYPNRKPHTGLMELKQIVAPFEVYDVAKDGSSFKIKNRRFFTTLEDLSLSWKIEQNGRTVRTGSVASLAIAPQKSRKYVIDVSGLSLCGECYITFFVQQRVATEWAEAGYEVGFAQAKLDVPTNAAAPNIFNASSMEDVTEVLSKIRQERHASVCTAPLSVAEDDVYITVSGSHAVYRIRKLTGLIDSCVSQGREMLASPISPTIWRAPTDNDRDIAPKWRKQHMDTASVICRKCDVRYASAESVTVRAVLLLASPIDKPLLTMDAFYTFLPDGSVSLRIDANVREDLLMLPRFGVQFEMPEDNEQLRYFGRGPVESYMDKRLASRQGLFSCRVSDHFEHYVRPQENMAHADTLWMFAGTLSGHGLLCSAAYAKNPISFNCCHFTPMQLTTTPHDYELVPMKETVINLDYRHNGIGSNSCGPSLDERFRFEEKKFTFNVQIKPCRIDEVDPFAGVL